MAVINFLNLRGGALRINRLAIASVEVSGETVAVALMNEMVYFFSGSDAAAVLCALEPKAAGEQRPTEQHMPDPIYDRSSKRGGGKK